MGWGGYLVAAMALVAAGFALGIVAGAAALLPAEPERFSDYDGD